MNESVAFRFIAGNVHPDHDTLAAIPSEIGTPEAAALDAGYLALQH